MSCRSAPNLDLFSISTCFPFAIALPVVQCLNTGHSWNWERFVTTQREVYLIVFPSFSDQAAHTLRTVHVGAQN